ncbi:cupin domain-containing protein [Hymenobacter sp. BT635]|uniref:Cupin domain-containing protein n=1 Tax=Hymenobacter nitidus TaxID=2880929 RepID=A0ABS8AAY0_9BACT|nr:cupin domain-containing protein [Hymenobacter nitidus]MCB2377339.1 cupin domain-containing protein [Hymenobacter nitidus]
MENTQVNLEDIDLNDLPLNTDPAMSVGDVLSLTDGVYFCIKDRDSVFLWVNENFARLVGQRQQDIIGTRDSRAAHVAHDKEVMASGIPLLNFHETIQVPTENGDLTDLEIVTQKGLLRKKGGTEIIGITVCFAERFPAAAQEADDLIERLHMVPTGIGGYLAPGLTGDFTLQPDALPPRFDGTRGIYSANYFLLKAGEFLQLHSLNQDEQWFFHQGSAIRLHAFSEQGVYSTVTLGSDMAQGQFFQGVAPHGQWFGAELLGPGYALVSCSLAPAWNKTDSGKPTPEQIEALKDSFPEQAAILELLR